MFLTFIYGYKIQQLYRRIMDGARAEMSHTSQFDDINSLHLAKLTTAYATKLSEKETDCHRVIGFIRTDGNGTNFQEMKLLTTKFSFL